MLPLDSVGARAKHENGISGFGRGVLNPWWCSSFAFLQMAFEGSCLVQVELCQMVAVVGFNLDARELGKLKEQLRFGEDWE